MARRTPIEVAGKKLYVGDSFLSRGKRVKIVRCDEHAPPGGGVLRGGKLHPVVLAEVQWPDGSRAFKDSDRLTHMLDGIDTIKRGRRR